MNSYFMDSKLTPRDIPVFCCVIWLHHILTVFHCLLCCKAKWNKNIKLWSKVYTGTTTHSLILGNPRLHLFYDKAIVSSDMASQMLIATRYIQLTWVHENMALSFHLYLVLHFACWWQTLLSHKEEKLDQNVFPLFVLLSVDSGEPVILLMCMVRV